VKRVKGVCPDEGAIPKRRELSGARGKGSIVLIDSVDSLERALEIKTGKDNPARTLALFCVKEVLLKWSGCVCIVGLAERKCAPRLGLVVAEVNRAKRL
jgi:hypothetical protein